MKIIFWVNVVVCSTLQCVMSKSLGDDTADPSVVCDAAKRTYRTAGYKEEDIYTLKRTENSLAVCGQDMTCCKRQAELNLVKLSEKKRTALAEPLEDHLNLTFQQTATSLKDLLREMIRLSQENSEAWLFKTYGQHYEKHRDVFRNLYNTFYLYLNGSELDLQTEINSFFAKLNEKIFVMMNPLTTFNQKYENCIFESTNYVQPFGIIQQKVQQQTYRSFLASRVFLQGLKEGLEVMMQLLRLPVHSKCSIAYMKMTQCSICSSVSESMKPCSNYCVNVMKGCFSYITLIQPKWNEYIKEMVALSEKLEGPFSFEAVIEPFAVKISGAIMVFQDNIGNITVKVEEKCGRLPVGNDLNKRKRRSTSDQTLNKTLSSLMQESEELVKDFTSNTDKILETLGKETTSNQKGIERSDSLPSTIPFRFTNDQKKKKASKIELLFSNASKALNEVLDYWVLLPEKLCGMGKSTENNTNCWNGKDTSGYNLSVVGSSVHDLFHRNPEMKLDPTLPDVDIVNYAKKLQVIIEKVKNTINGNPTVCVDCTGETDEESGSGSGETGESGDGSGSGFIRTTKMTTPEDPCKNSVDGRCVNDIRTTRRPNEVDNEINFVPKLNIQTESKRSSSAFLSVNVLLLTLTTVVAML